jgi:hypothetical protein
MSQGQNDTIEKLDELIEQCRELTNAVSTLVPRNVTTNTISGGSLTWVSVSCLLVCVVCLISIGLVTWVVGIELGKQDHEIHDLRAWRDMHQGRLDKLDAWKSIQEKQK